MTQKQTTNSEKKAWQSPALVKMPIAKLTLGGSGKNEDPFDPNSLGGDSG